MTRFKVKWSSLGHKSNPKNSYNDSIDLYLLSFIKGVNNIILYIFFSSATEAVYKNAEMLWSSRNV